MDPTPTYLQAEPKVPLNTYPSSVSGSLLARQLATCATLGLATPFAGVHKLTCPCPHVPTACMARAVTLHCSHARLLLSHRIRCACTIALEALGCPMGHVRSKGRSRWLENRVKLGRGPTRSLLLYCRNRKAPCCFEAHVPSAKWPLLACCLDCTQPYLSSLLSLPLEVPTARSCNFRPARLAGGYLCTRGLRCYCPFQRLVERLRRL